MMKKFKSKGKKIKNEKSFADWILTNNFPLSFKNLVKKIILELNNKNKQTSLL